MNWPRTVLKPSALATLAHIASTSCSRFTPVLNNQKKARSTHESTSEHFLLWLKPRLRVLEWRGDLLSRINSRAGRAWASRHLLRAGRLRASAASRYAGP